MGRYLIPIDVDKTTSKLVFKQMLLSLNTAVLEFRDDKIPIFIVRAPKSDLDTKKDNNCAGSLHRRVLIDDNDGRSEPFAGLQQTLQDPLVVVGGLARDQGASDQTALPFVSTTTKVFKSMLKR